jgi:hypothetical protein
MIEPFVDPAKPGEFLAVTRRRVLDMARLGKVPAHPLGFGYDSFRPPGGKQPPAEASIHIGGRYRTIAPRQRIRGVCL